MIPTPSGYLLSTGREIEGDILPHPPIRMWDTRHGRWLLKYTLTQEEKREIAEYAINEWKKWEMR
jgi:hypothetical protein